MGVEVHPVFNPPVKRLQFMAEGRALMDDLEALDLLARSLELAPLSAFMDRRQLQHDFGPPPKFDSDPDLSADSTGAAGPRFYSSYRGLRTVNGLIEALRTNPLAAEELLDAETVLKDLKELARCLNKAITKGARFRLEVR